MLHFACSTENFPLTLALSLREREQQAPDRCLADGRWENSGTGVAARRWTILPLPRERAGGTECSPSHGPISRNNLKRPGRILRKLLLATFWFAGAVAALAEHYLSVAEAQKICFLNASKFEAQQLRPSADQSKTIEQKSGGKVRKTEIRFSVARKDADTIGVLMVDQVIGKHELIDYAVAISREGKVLQVEILEYREHYGGEIHNLKWRDQFKGKTAASKLKLNDDIYNISGATISCRNVSDGVRRVLATFELVLRSGLAPGDGLPNTRAAPP